MSMKKFSLGHVGLYFLLWMSFMETSSGVTLQSFSLNIRSVTAVCLNLWICTQTFLYLSIVFLFLSTRWLLALNAVLSHLMQRVGTNRWRHWSVSFSIILGMNSAHINCWYLLTDALWTDYLLRKLMEDDPNIKMCWTKINAVISKMTQTLTTKVFIHFVENPSGHSKTKKSIQQCQ